MATFYATGPDTTNTAGVLPRLPGQQYLVKKTPSFSTTRVQSRSGRTIRIPNWSYPIWRFSIAYEMIRDRPSSLPELSKMWAFFTGIKLGGGEFKFFDPFDCQVTAQAFGTGDGATTQFQLLRTIGPSTGFDIAEPVWSVWGAPGVYVAGVLKTVGTDYAISTTGLVTFTSAPAASAALTWTGFFMFLCEFDKDELDIAQLLYDIWEGKDVSFSSVKP